jgi:hypothetical protein
MATTAPLVNAVTRAVNAKSSPVFTRAVAVMIGLVLVLIFFIVVFSLIVQESATPPRVYDPLVKEAIIRRQKEMNSLGGINSFYSSMTQTSSPVYLAPNERYLVNLCPLTASVGGYLGPLNDGVFEPSIYIEKAINAGIRSFVLPISVYYDDNKIQPNWPLSGTPTIVYRDAQGTILSLNGLKLLTFCQILIEKKSMNSAQANEPILLFLHGVKGELPTQEPAYVKFTSLIAEGLKPIDKYRMQTAQGIGSIVGGNNQDKILTQIPLTELANKIIVFTNFDITAGLKKPYKNIRPTLADYTNFVYSPLTATESSTRLCRSTHIAEVKPSFTDAYRTSWLSTLEDHVGVIHKPEDVNRAIVTGVQCVPLPFLSAYVPVLVDPKTKQPGADASDLMKIYKQWGGFAFRVRQGDKIDSFVNETPKNARYSSPEPVVPMKPATTLNARVDKDAAPGMLVVK